MCVSNRKVSHDQAEVNLPAAGPNVAILLCTHNGARFLREQLDSIANQSHANWAISVSDDGSTDATRSVLHGFQGDFGQHRLNITSGPAVGSAANFISLVCSPKITADYYAFADQDDVWERDKLTRSLAWLQAVPSEVPALYCSRTQYIGENGSFLGFSKLFERTPTFRNAVIQSIAGGNTMVFNQSARELFAKTPPDVKVVAHDWWSYMLITGCGGRVFYDPVPTVRYRQHGNNIVGQNTTVGARISRAKALMTGRFKSWNEINLHALNRMRPYLTSDSQMALDTFIRSRKKILPARLLGLWRSGIYRQTSIDNIGLFLAATLNKL